MEKCKIEGFVTTSSISDIYPKYEIEDWTVVMEDSEGNGAGKMYIFDHTQDPPFVLLSEPLTDEEHGNLENFEDYVHVGLDGVVLPRKLGEILDMLQWSWRGEKDRSEACDVLIVPRHDYESEKTRTAKEKGIPVQTLFEFCWAYLWPRHIHISKKFGRYYIYIAKKYADERDLERIWALEEAFEYVITTTYIPCPYHTPWNQKIRSLL